MSRSVFDEWNSDEEYGYYESEYEGTYVHDIAGWDDDTIDDVLDGEPDAYWNLD